MITIANDFNLRPFNTFRIDAKCREWIEYTLPSDIPNVISHLSGSKFINIGAGSNMLFVNDYDGAILHSRILDIEMHSCSPEQIVVRAGAGVEMDALINQLCQAGLWGLENLSGIPGEVGASAVQNVGAYGVEAADSILSVECYDTLEKCFVEFSNAECEYGYRYSMFKNAKNHNRYVITFVNFVVTRVPAPKISYGSLKELPADAINDPLRIREKIIDIRNQKLPLVDEIGSAGSFFKNPVISKDKFELVKKIIEHDGACSKAVPHYQVNDGIKIPAAWLIDYCGLKGATSGGASVWHKQPLVIVNTTGRASAADIVSLEQHIINTVREKFGIILEPEVEHIM